jgi:hypothetical protein
MKIRTRDLASDFESKVQDLVKNKQVTRKEIMAATLLAFGRRMNK